MTSSKSRSDRIDVLIVDGESDRADVLSAHLSRDADHVWQVAVAETVSAALEHLSEKTFDAVLLSLDVPIEIAAVSLVCAHAGGSALMVTSPRTDEALGIEAIQRGAEDYRAISDLAPGELGRTLLLAIVRHKAQMAETRQYRSFFDGNPHPMWVYDGDSLQFLAVNDAAIRQYGYSRPELLSMTLGEIRPPEEREAFAEQVAERRRDPEPQLFKLARTWKHQRKDGTLIDVEITVSPIRFKDRDALLALATDVTDKKRVEAQFLHSQKLESVGLLAAGVAHDFNNLLGIVTGYGELIARDFSPGDPTARRLAEILKAASRASDLTKQLLAFSRKQVMELRVLSLADVITDVEPMLRRVLKADIELLVVHADALSNVRADPGQIGQVLVNLAVNARDAMPSGGRLVIETDNVELDDDYAALRPDVTPGRYVSLSVSDTGMGMSAETVSHIFEPFYTTKAEGHGTGLGLSTVYGIVKQSGGHIWTYSELGKGTTFRLYFPCVDKPKEGLQATAPPVASNGGSETILVVEDNDALRSIITEVLEEAGYSIHTASNGEEALAVVLALRRPIDIVISDVVMPIMGGIALVERLQPVRVLFMSGYSELAVAHQGTLTPAAAFLEKPFSPSTLLRKVRETLDANGAAG